MFRHNGSMPDHGSNSSPRFSAGVPSGFTTLVSGDMDRAGVFYDALGFVPHDRSGEGMLWFERTGRGVIVIAARAALIELIGVDPGFPGGTVLSLDVGSEIEVDRLCAAGVQAGGTLCKAPDLTPWGAYAGWLADPDGFTWEIGFHPRSPFDDEGRLRPSEG